MNFSSCLLNLVSLLLLLLFSMTSEGVPDYELFMLFLSLLKLHQLYICINYYYFRIGFVVMDHVM